MCSSKTEPQSLKNSLNVTKDLKMTRQPNSALYSLKPYQRFLLVQGLGWMSAFSLFSGGMAWANSSAVDLTIETAPIENGSGSESEAMLDPAPLGIEPASPATAPDLTIRTVPEESSLEAPIEPYIDATGYSIGATQQESEKPPTTWQPQTPTGYSTSAPIAAMSPESYRAWLAAPGTTTTAGRSYYYRTARPAGRLGNGNIRLIFPLAIPAIITSAFGWRVHPITGTPRLHSGTDLGAPLGTPVLAAYAGNVAIADFLGGYGLTVALQHNKQTQETLYAHLSEVFVKPGEWVEQGAVIGRVGSTGSSTGPHLHFEFRQQTPDGWVAMDAGSQLEYALAQLIQTMEKNARSRSTPAKAG
jgi:murein DD-endopeptidase MepM/ murein hydrolase activator NlpD